MLKATESLAKAISALLAGKPLRLQLLVHLVCIGLLAERSPEARAAVLERLAYLRKVLESGPPADGAADTQKPST